MTLLISRSQDQDYSLRTTFPLWRITPQRPASQEEGEPSSHMCDSSTIKIYLNETRGAKRAHKALSEALS